MKKIYLVRDIDIEYLGCLENGANQGVLEDRLTNEYGSHGYGICAYFPVYEKERIIAYKIIFVKNSDEEE